MASSHFYFKVAIVSGRFCLLTQNVISTDTGDFWYDSKPTAFYYLSMDIRLIIRYLLARLDSYKGN